MRKRRVIFLDIDGVLICWDKKISAYPEKFDRERVSLLRQAVEELELKLVISSGWRDQRNWLKKIRNAFSEAGWQKPPIIGRTPLGGRGRGEQIQSWLIDNPVESYVILDDIWFDILSEQVDRLIKCDELKGLRPKHVTAIKRLFS